MEFNHFYSWVHDRWGEGRKPNELLLIGLGLGGEAGEVLEQIKKYVRDDKMYLTSSRELKLMRELGDVIHYWCRVCQHFDINPNDIFQENLNKLTDRDLRRAKEGLDPVP